MIHLDTSILIDAFVPPGRRLFELERAVADGERFACSTVALFEWLRGPRTPGELLVQSRLLPAESLVAFDDAEAQVAADLYRKVARPRGREIDLMIAACAIAHEARLWTLNPADFKDVPQLTLYRHAGGAAEPSSRT